MSNLDQWDSVIGVTSGAIAVAVFLWRLFARFAKAPDVPIIDTLTLPKASSLSRPAPFMSFHGITCPHEKMRQLVGALFTARQSQPNYPIDVDEEQHGEIACLLEDLEELQFLQPGDLLDTRYRLQDLISRGQRAHVWEAVDITQENRPVVLKVLKYSFCITKDSLDRFLSSARLLRDSHPRTHWPVVSDVRAPALEPAGDCLAYYVMNHVPGIPLEDYVLHRASRLTQQQWLAHSIELTAKLMELARSVADMHVDHIVHSDIQPSNILVCLDDQGRIKRCCLIDIDAWSSSKRTARKRKKDRNQLQDGAFDERGLGYVAPELLQGHMAQSPQSDVFSLTRVIMFVFRGKQLPHPYASGSPELIRHLYCPPRLRKPLLTATNISPLQRQNSMGILVAEIEGALAHEKNAAAHTRWAALCAAERPNITQTLRYAFVGALIPMLFLRPWPAMHQWVHLSDSFAIGVFHAFLGSLVWGVFITSGFLLYQTLLEQTHLKRSSMSGYVLAGMCGALGGFLGGVLCAVLGATITNACTLRGLGWIAAGVDCDALQGQGMDKAMYTLATNLFWAYPLTGTFTGLGLGLWLNLKVNQLSAAKVADVLPVPKRKFEANESALRASIRFVFRNWASHLILMLPIAAAALALWVFPQPAEEPFIQVWRALGEGSVHYMSAVGLAIGYFLGVAPRGRQ